MPAADGAAPGVVAAAGLEEAALTTVRPLEAMRLATATAEAERVTTARLALAPIVRLAALMSSHGRTLAALSASRLTLRDP